MYSEYKGAQALAYCHEALHRPASRFVQNKLQKAGYEAKTVEWDTDSDSNASCEEDLKQ